jgi:AcrR family transcriptional regulator
MEAGVAVTKGRRPKPRAKRDDSEARKRILQASRRLLSQGGLEALTISQVAEEAGVYSSAIFYHFGGKEGLLFDLSVELIQESTFEATADIFSTPLGRERIDKVVDSYFMIGGPEVQAGTIQMQAPAMWTPEMRPDLVRIYEESKDQLADALGAREHPEHRELLRQAGWILLSFTEGLTLEVLVHPQADYTTALSFFKDMLYQWLAPVLGLDAAGPADRAHS